MAKFLFEAKYTLDGVRGLRAEGGSARVAAVTAAIEAAGGRLESLYFAFGENDVYVTADLPDNASAAGFALAVVAAGGATVRTVALLTPSEIDGAVRMESTYRPPGE